LQTLTILAGAGKFRLGARLDPNDNSVVTWTAAIPFDASAADVLATLSAILNPNNTNPALPFTDNVAVSRHGNVYHSLLQCQYRRLMLLPTDIDVSLLQGTAILATREDGLNYYGIENLTVNLGSGNDHFDIASTGAATILNTAAGTDTVNVRTIDHDTTINTGAADDLVNVGSEYGLSTAPGTLNAISGLLTINGGDQTGQDILNVDDAADPTDNAGRLTATRILGLGMAQGIVYGTIDRLNLYLGSGNDHLRIYSTHGNETDAAERALNKETYVTTG